MAELLFKRPHMNPEAVCFSWGEEQVTHKKHTALEKVLPELIALCLVATSYWNKQTQCCRALQIPDEELEKPLGLLQSRFSTCLVVAKLWLIT
jgi:hypothetical protein